MEQDGANKASLANQAKVESFSEKSSEVPKEAKDKNQKLALVEKTFELYCDTLERNLKQYTLIEERRKKALLRLDERLAANDQDMAAVYAEFSRAIENLGASQWHRDNGQFDWTEQIFSPGMSLRSD